MTDYQIVQAMRIYGGSFAEALANLFDRADPENQQIIKDAWPDLWVQYADMARMRADRKEREA